MGRSSSATLGNGPGISTVVTPTATSKTYNLGATSSSGTLTIAASATYPVYIMVELV